jgi:hypothetical protein
LRVTCRLTFHGPTPAFSGHERISPLFDPDLSPHTKHLENRIAILIVLASMTAILVFVPIQELVISPREVGAFRHRFACSRSIAIISGSEQPKRAVVEPIEHAVLG